MLHYGAKTIRLARRKIMANVDLTTIKSNSVVDARGSACPGPLLEAKKAIGTVKIGEVLEVLSNDPGTKEDIPLWAQKVGHDCLGFLSADGYDRIFVVRKK
jgi:tRNA 2-thiouridine synthesizing protein A